MRTKLNIDPALLSASGVRGLFPIVVQLPGDSHASFFVPRRRTSAEDYVIRYEYIVTPDDDPGVYRRASWGMVDRGELVPDDGSPAIALESRQAIEQGLLEAASVRLGKSR